MITKRKYPWIAEQVWSDILFLHWSVHPNLIRSFVPEPFMIDMFDGNAWVSVVVFRAKESLIRNMPKWTSFPPVTQINVRTYVKHPITDERGVYFFSLHVDSLLAVLGARTLYGLPFHYVTNTWHSNNKMINIDSSFHSAPIFSVTYQPKDNIIHDKRSQFLTERYCIWAIHGKRIVKIPIIHTKWRLSDVHVQLEHNELVHFLNKNCSTDFIAHYSTYKDARLFPYETFGLYERISLKN